MVMARDGIGDTDLAGVQEEGVTILIECKSQLGGTLQKPLPAAFWERSAAEDGDDEGAVPSDDEDGNDTGASDAELDGDADPRANDAGGGGIDDGKGADEKIQAIPKERRDTIDRPNGHLILEFIYKHLPTLMNGNFAATGTFECHHGLHKFTRAVSDYEVAMIQDYLHREAVQFGLHGGTITVHPFGVRVCFLGTAIRGLKEKATKRATTLRTHSLVRSYTNLPAVALGTRDQAHWTAAKFVWKTSRTGISSGGVPVGTLPHKLLHLGLCNVLYAEGLISENGTEHPDNTPRLLKHFTVKHVSSIERWQGGKREVLQVGDDIALDWSGVTAYATLGKFMLFENTESKKEILLAFPHWYHAKAAGADGNYLRHPVRQTLIVHRQQDQHRRDILFDMPVNVARIIKQVLVLHSCKRVQHLPPTARPDDTDIDESEADIQARKKKEKKEKKAKKQVKKKKQAEFEMKHGPVLEEGLLRNDLCGIRLSCLKHDAYGRNRNRPTVCSEQCTLQPRDYHVKSNRVFEVYQAEQGYFPEFSVGSKD